MSFRRFVQDYFTFSLNERKGITVLLILIFILGIANKIFFYFEEPNIIDVNLLQQTSNRLEANNDSLTQEKAELELFLFNPNTIDSLTLTRLDIPTFVKSNLLKFRNKNGKFYSKSDFRKIYGVTDELYAEVEPFLVIDPIKPGSHSAHQKMELFQFDPNMATDSEFRSLGFSDQQITSIRNYLNKGEVFRTKDDFNKIVDISDDQKRLMLSFIRIGNTPKSVNELIKTGRANPIELNSTDSVLLESLPGIGDKLSKRIVKYRDLLGGYYSVLQLKEVYGLSEQTLQGISELVCIDTTKIRKLDLNFSDIKELARHPYIQKEMADKIVKFRSTNGQINNSMLLLDNMILNIDQYKRLKPYL
jgi:DNA uptake protein ComE-like DNA-binding protein